MKITPWIVVALAGSMAFVSLTYDMNKDKPVIAATSTATPAVLTAHLMLTSNQTFNTALLKELPSNMTWTDKSTAEVSKAISAVWDKGVLDHKEMASLVFEVENASGEQVSRFLAKPHLESYLETAKDQHWHLLGERQSSELAPASNEIQANIATQ
jgi:hypothetical protein